MSRYGKDHVVYGGDVKFNTRGIDETVRMLEKLAGKDFCDDMCRDAVREGANVVADFMRSKIEKLKTTKSDTTGDKRYRKDKRYCTENEKKGLLASMGWAPIEEKFGVYDSNVGFDGYNKFTSTHQANAKIANFINRGTTYMITQPFISQTRNAGVKQATEEMKKQIEYQIDFITTGVR